MVSSTKKVPVRVIDARVIVTTSAGSTASRCRLVPVHEANRAKTDAIRAAQEAGRIPRTLEAEDLLAAIATLIYGNLVLADGIDNYTPQRREALGRTVRQLVAG